MLQKPQIDETELLRRIAAGDHMAFKRIYDAYRSQVLTFADKYLKSRTRSEEVMQEVFLKLWLMKDQLLAVRDLENYLLMMTRNKAYDMLRQSQREQQRLQPISDDTDSAEDDLTEEKLILAETRGILERGIELLPPQQKRAYQLCHQQGLKYEEAAEAMSLSPQTIHRHMKLALAFLRKYLAEHTDLAVILIIFKII